MEKKEKEIEELKQKIKELEASVLQKEEITKSLKREKEAKDALELQVITQQKRISNLDEQLAVYATQIQELVRQVHLRK